MLELELHRVRSNWRFKGPLSRTTLAAPGGVLGMKMKSRLGMLVLALEEL